ncbi:MAG: AmmeMemoRadiSam system radical SAM enzyme [Lachnospiraceae bacterium]|nr:AmmeMemoRadiSam system radical SAM enzyme [Lachnospiraceae bacterium]
MSQARCNVCFRACLLTEGQTGACLARGNRDGNIVPLTYGLLTSLALDPIEKKPLNRFYPGSMVLSAGSSGCNLKCVFCQNHEISQARLPESGAVEQYSPRELCDLALRMRDRGNIGVAYTYNEPLVGYEFVRDTARLVHENGMKNVLVTAGCVSPEVLHEILPYIDAMNIDLKSFRQDFYRNLCQGDADMTKAFIAEAAKHCHVEITTLVIPGENDTEDEIRAIASWIASLNGGRGREIPYHISRFFPRYRMTDRPATDVPLIYRLADTARAHLSYVYTGNC